MSDDLIVGISVSVDTWLAKMRTKTGRLWTYVRDDRPFGEQSPPAAIYTLIATAKLNDIDPETWLADVLCRISDHLASRLDELLTWNWKALPATLAA